MMQKLLARLVPHRRVLSVVLTLAVVTVVGYGVLVSRAPRAMARQPQTVASTVATPTVPSAAPSASPALPVPPPSAAPAETPPEVTWPERVTGRVVDAQKQPLPGVSIVNDGKETRTEADGTFVLTKPSGAVL